MILIDNETTNLTSPESAPIEQQPCIVEFAAIKLDDSTLKETGRFEFLCKPKYPIPIEAIKITGITNEMVKSKPPFIHFLPELTMAFLGEKIVVAHNLSFDLAALKYELQRIDRVTAFPWPPERICTVEKTLHIKGYRLKLADLHLELTGKEHKDAHRAMADVEALVNIIRAMRKKGLV